METHDAFHDLMGLIQQAAAAGDLATIEKLTRIANALRSKPTQDTLLGLPPNQSAGNQSGHANVGISKGRDSRKARGNSKRAEWLSKLSKSGLFLTHLGRRTYETSKRTRVGVAYASEHADRPDKWWLGLRDEPYSVIVLLCEDQKGKVLDFVIPSQTFSPFWKSFSRHGGQVEFHVERTGSNHALRVPGGSSVPINSSLGDYKPLQ